jgi:hypothetical protein
MYCQFWSIIFGVTRLFYTDARRCLSTHHNRYFGYFIILGDLSGVPYLKDKNDKNMTKIDNPLKKGKLQNTPLKYLTHTLIQENILIDWHFY